VRQVRWKGEGFFQALPLRGKNFKGGGAGTGLSLKRRKKKEVGGEGAHNDVKGYRKTGDREKMRNLASTLCNEH